MKKLTLELDSLAVESFEPVAEPAAPRGTVQGQQAPPTEHSCYGPSCEDHTCTCPTWADNSCYPQTYCIG